MRNLIPLLLVVFTVINAFGQAESIIHASNGTSGDKFGFSVSISGNYAISGSPEDSPNGSKSGSVYFYENVAGSWVEKQNINPSDGGSNHLYGSSVAIDGSWAVVGARQFGTGNNLEGQIYIYHRNNAGVWSLFTSFKNGYSSFGFSVSIDGDYLAAGAIKKAGTISGVFKECGSAVIYRYNGSIWAKQAEVFPSDGDTGFNFGNSITIHGSQLLVGAYRAKHGGSTTGAGYVFSRLGTVWTEDAKLVAFDASSGDEFGFSSSIFQDRIVIGSPRDNAKKGGVYFFRKVSSTWSLDNKITAFDGATGEYFGTSCDFINGSTAIVGADRHKVGNPRKGAIYLYEYNDNTNKWIDNTITDQILASDGNGYDYFGGSVSANGNYVFTGAYRDDNLGASSGGGYFYDISTAILPIELVSFEATVINNREVILDWVTASEFNNEGFEIQRSQDGVTWENIGWEEGVGNSSEAQHYSILDNNPYQGINYYRLNQMDFDGNATLSIIISAFIEELDEALIKDISFSIYPNPTKDFLYLKYDFNKVEISSIIIYSVTGKVMWVERSNKKEINLIDLPKGNYFLSIETKTGRFNQAFLKE